MNGTKLAKAALLAPLASALAATAPAALFADAYYSTVADQFSFRNANWKRAGDAEATAPAAGNDYIAVHQIRAGGLSSADAVDEFVGDTLQIGEVGGRSGTLLWKKQGAVKVPRLILANGSILCGDGNAAIPFSGGTTTVLSPESAPFALGKTGSELWNDRAYSFSASHAFAGEEGAALKVLTSKTTLTLSGASPDYLGKWLFAPERFMTLRLGDPAALGGDRKTFAADSVRISVGNKTDFAMVLDFDGAMPCGGRGLTVDSPLVINVTTGKVECAMSISGSSSLTVAGGVGALYEMDADSRTPSARAGFVSDGRNALMLGSVAVPVTVNSGTLCVTNFTGGSFALKAGARLAARIHADGTADATSFAPGTALTVEDAKIRLHVYGAFPLASMPVRVAVLKIPAGVRAVAADDFALTADDFGLAEKSLEVAADEDGVQTVYLALKGNVVCYSNYAEGAHYAMPGQYWSDGLAVHSDADYLVGYGVDSRCSLIRGQANSVFKGRSLTLAPGAVFMVKGEVSKPSVVDDLRLSPGSVVRTGFDGTNVVTGAVTILGDPADGPATLTLERDSAPVLFDATLRGSNALRLRNDLGGGKYRVCEMLRESPEFTGAVETELYGLATRGIALVLHDELNLGANPASFNPEQLLFNCNTTLRAADTFAIDDANRGFTINAPAIFDVDEGRTLALAVPMAVNAALAKTGAGTLGVGGTVGGTSDSLSVSEGFVRPVSKAASSALKYSFADGAGLNLALRPSDSGVAADGLYVEDASRLTLGGALPVRVEGAIAGNEAVVVGLLNVPSSMADAVSAAIGGSVKFFDTERGVAKSYDVSSVSLDGGRVRFYTRIGRRGFVITIR